MNNEETLTTFIQNYLNKTISNSDNSLKKIMVKKQQHKNLKCNSRLLGIILTMV